MAGERRRLRAPGAVLWDMDGTLIDQTAAIIRCYREVISDMGHSRPDERTIRRSLGGPMASTMALFVEADRLDEAARRFRDRFPEVMFEGLIVQAGARALMRRFHGLGVRQAILTNKDGGTARAVSRHCGFDVWAPICLGHGDTEWSKPDPRLTRLLLERMNASDAGACLIGDSPTDVDTAKQAGLPCYGVATGAHGVAELRAAGAADAFEDLRALATAFGP